MWISQQGRCAGRQEHDAHLAVVTAQGQQTGVYLDGHQRTLPVAAPGGYRWKPQNGQQVLVMKSGADAEVIHIVAQQEEDENDLKPGEVELYGHGSSIKIDAEGNVRIQGAMLINGVALQDMIEMAVQGALARQGGT